MIESLSAEQQAAVREFIEYLKGKPRNGAFLRAAEEFMDEHPELLRRLAQ